MTGAKFESFGSAYQELARTVRAHGVDAAPRGNAVTELRWPHIWHIVHPERWNLLIPGRKFNPFFALAEVVWMWSGKGGADFISFYNKSITQFLDQGIPYFHGSYGRRVRMAGYDEHPFRHIPSTRTQPGSNGSIPVVVDQLEHVIRKIQRDPHTRQAVVSLWDPVKDNLVESKDHPCNNTLYFQQRDGALNMTVVRRSNDLILGVPYNMCQFAHLQALVAGALGVEMGHYSVMANNLHYYHDLYPDTLALVQEWAHMSDFIRVAAVNDTMPTLAMEWDLTAFDHFVRNAWEPFEKTSRIKLSQSDAEKDDLNPFYEMQRVMLVNQMAQNNVPAYWQDLFLTLLAFHAYKGKAKDVFIDLFIGLQAPMQWQIMDFWSKHDTIMRIRKTPHFQTILDEVTYG
jgi:hypothetical protein